MSSKGIQDLGTILASLDPELCPHQWIFTKIAAPNEAEMSQLMVSVYALGVAPIATFLEAEGLTLIVKKIDLSKLEGMEGFEFADTSFARITLLVHSSLDAVGLTALVSAKLTELNISANVVAGYYHDHFFVQSTRAAEAMDILRAIAAEHRPPVGK